MYAVLGLKYRLDEKSTVCKLHISGTTLPFLLKLENSFLWVRKNRNVERAWTHEFILLVLSIDVTYFYAIGSMSFWFHIFVSHKTQSWVWNDIVAHAIQIYNIPLFGDTKIIHIIFVTKIPKLSSFSFL